MTSRQTNRSRVLRRVGAVLTAAVALGAVATSAGVSAKKPSAIPTGGDLKVAIRDTFPGWCTGNNPAGSALMATRTIYDSVFEKTAGGDLVGMLAESATPASDLKSWTIKLRTKSDGSPITFHDGEPFNAAALKFNMDASRGKLTATYLTLLTDFATKKAVYNAAHSITDAASTAWQGDAATLAAYQAWAGAIANKTAIPTHVLGTSVPFQANILSIDVVSDYVVKINLDRPQNDLTSTMYASGRFFVRSPRQILGWPADVKTGASNHPIPAAGLNSSTSTFGAGGSNYCGTFPIGTGPFKVESSYVFDKDHLKVVKNPDYWRKDAKGTQLPYLDSIQFDNIKEAVAASNAIQTGGYHVAQFGGATDGTFIKNLRLKKSKLTEFKTPYEYYPSVWFNQKIYNAADVGSAKAGTIATDTLFKYKECRDAVSYGLDRVTYVKKRGNNEMRAPKSLVGPTSIMYTTKGFIQYNKAKAIAKVAECKAKAGASALTFAIPADRTNSSYQNSMEVKRQLNAIGFNLSIDQDDSTNIINKAFNATAKNQYTMINILLLEGTDVGFNLPFLVTNSFNPNFSANPLKALYGPTGSVRLGDILNLNLHSDEQVDTLLYAAQKIAPKANGQLNYATAGPAFKKATEYIQTQNLMTSIGHQYVSIFTTKKVGGVGTLKTPGGKSPRVVTNWGIQYAGVYLNK